MNQALLEKIESEQFRKNPVEFAVGDTVRVHTKVIEGDKERIQIFTGVVIGKRGRGLNEMFTVRRISYGEGVERVFPVHSPRVDKIEVERKGSVRRAKLTYLRKRIGKGAVAVKEKEMAALQFVGGDGSSNGQKPVVKGDKVGRNDPCPCGSGKKYKKCHGA